MPLAKHKIKHISKHVSWTDIDMLISDVGYKSFLKEIDPSVFTLVLDEDKRPQVTASILTMLQIREPENATQEYAEEIVNLMQKVAQKILVEDKTHSLK